MKRLVLAFGASGSRKAAVAEIPRRIVDGREAALAVELAVAAA